MFERRLLGYYRLLYFANHGWEKERLLSVITSVVVNQTPLSMLNAETIVLTRVQLRRTRLKMKNARQQQQQGV